MKKTLAQIQQEILEHRHHQGYVPAHLIVELHDARRDRHEDTSLKNDTGVKNDDTEKRGAAMLLGFASLIVGSTIMFGFKGLQVSVGGCLLFFGGVALLAAFLAEEEQ